MENKEGRRKEFIEGEREGGFGEQNLLAWGNVRLRIRRDCTLKIYSPQFFFLIFFIFYVTQQTCRDSDLV